MASEILSIPENNLKEIIEVIRTGLKHLDYVSDETKIQLNKWCNEMTKYLKR